ncbi:MAG TPA: glycosyltransferase family 4 protein [Bacteroidia bacterium]|jgi:glycosyltransferase involved in cell wall biosynthesis|nr:glycosyltransferase family 4 protein [Bacteroidia bacterium]
MDNSKLHVLFISSWYPNKKNPLLGIFVKRHASAVAKLCNTSSIYIYSDKTNSIEEEVEDGVYTIRIGYKQIAYNIPLISTFVKMSRYFKAYKKAIDVYIKKKGSPDIVNLNVIFPVGIMALYMKRELNIPYIVTEHWTGYFEEDGRYKGVLMKLLTKRVVNKASAVVTVSNDLKNKMIEKGLNNQYTVISNIVDTELFNIPAERKLTDTTRFIHVSSLEDTQKNVSGILRSFQKVHKQFNNTELIIVGNGSGRESLQEYSKELGLDDSVQFVGEKTTFELVNLLQQASVFILFSNYETQAIVLLESLCCGTPVITTNVAGVREYITSENGILIEPKDEPQLSSSMISVIQNKDRFKDSRNIRASVVTLVNGDTIAKQFLGVYNKVLSRDN